MKPNTANFDRMLEAYAAFDPRVAPSDNCPDRERLWAAAAAELPLTERCELLDHTLECAYCAESWRLAVELDARPVVPLPGQILAILWQDLQFLIRLPRRLLLYLEKVTSEFSVLQPVLAMVAVLAAGLIILRMNSSPPQNGIDVVQNDTALESPSEDPAASRGGSPIESLLPEGEILRREHAVLVWDGPPGAVYDLRIMTDTGQVLDSATALAETTYPIPVGKLQPLEPGSALRWEVSLRLPDGQPAKPARFRVTVE